MVEENTEQLMSDAQRNKLLREIHHSLIGDPLNPTSMGIVALVGKHDETLYGKTGKNGLRGDNERFKKLFWIGSGIVVAAQIGFAWFLAAHYTH